jgi:hypothetical protein
MADNIRCDEVVERIRLTAVPCVEETTDYGLDLLSRCVHGEAPSPLVVPSHLDGRANEAMIAIASLPRVVTTSHWLRPAVGRLMV